MSKISKIIMSHLMRWILPKQTKVHDTESEQQKNILKSRKAGMGEGGGLGRNAVSLRYLPGVGLSLSRRTGTVL